MRNHAEIIHAKNLVCISLGGNEGDVPSSMKRAVQSLGMSGFGLIAVSSIYKTSPVDCPRGTPDFYNAIALGKWHDSPHSLLELCKEVENKLGRKQSEKGKNRPRPIDIDIVFFGNERIVDADTLVLPHPRATSRLFVMLPLTEIVPDTLFPGTKKTMKQILESLEKKTEMKKILKNKIRFILA